MKNQEHRKKDSSDGLSPEELMTISGIEAEIESLHLLEKPEGSSHFLAYVGNIYEEHSKSESSKSKAGSINHWLGSILSIYCLSQADKKVILIPKISSESLKEVLTLLVIHDQSTRKIQVDFPQEVHDFLLNLFQNCSKYSLQAYREALSIISYDFFTQLYH